MFLAECSAHLREVGRCAVWELRALRITVERMTPCAGRRHALEQSLLRPAARRGRAACDHHVARTLDLVESEPLAVEEDEFRDGEGTLHRMLVCMKGGAGAGGESTGLRARREKGTIILLGGSWLPPAGVLTPAATRRRPPIGREKKERGAEAPLEKEDGGTTRRA